MLIPVNVCCFNAEGVAEELMFQSATPDFISSSEINTNLSASREEWKLVYISEAQP
jgi:hypothetical protein